MDYDSSFSFDNDFSTLLPDTDTEGENNGDLLVAKTEKGQCRIICFSLRHDLTLPELEIDKIRNVVDLWVDEYRHLGSKPFTITSRF